MKNNKNAKFFLIAVLVIAALTAVDQWTKHLAVLYLKNQSDIDLIPGVFKLQYLENHGAAFGVLQNQQWLFSILTTVFLVFAFYTLYRIPKQKPFFAAYWILTVLTAGAIGNYIDRLSQKYVVDFAYFSLIDFPIFNVADIYCTLSVIAFFLLILFGYKEDEFDQLLQSILPHKKKVQE